MRFLSIFFLLACSVNAQEYFKVTWQLEETFYPVEVVQDSEGFNYVFMNRGFGISDSSFFILAKYSSNYEPIWSKAIGLNYPVKAGDVELIGDSIFLVAGNSYLDSGFSNRNFFMRINMEGDVEEAHFYIESGNLFNSPIIREVNGDRMLLFRSAWIETPTHFLHLDDVGNAIESFGLYAGERPIRIMDIVKHDDGFMYSTGTVRHSELSHIMPFIMCTDTGQVLWFKAFDVTQSAGGYSISVSPSGEILIGGYILEDGSFPASTSAFVIKTNDTGDVLLSKKVEKDEVSAEYVADLIHMDDYSLIWFHYDNYSNNVFSYLSNLDISLSPSWTKSQSDFFSYSSDERIQDSAAVALGLNIETQEIFTEKIPIDTGEMCDVNDYVFSFVDIQIEPYTTQVDYEYYEVLSTQNEVSSVDFDMEVLEICPETLTIEEPVEMSFSAYPNPFQDRFTLDIPSGMSRLDVFLVDGTKIKSFNTVEGLFEVDLSAYNPGIYVLQLFGKSSSLRQRVIKL